MKDFHINMPVTLPQNLGQMINSLEDEEEIVNMYLNIYLDASGSVEKIRQIIIEQITGILSGLTKANKDSADLRILVKLLLFNDKVVALNDVHMLPEQVADIFTSDKYVPRGTTSGKALFDSMDKELSSASPAIQALKKHHPGMYTVVITDAKLNDNESLRAQARQILETNRHFRDHNKMVVVFLGEEQDKASAVAIANGNEDGVITVEDDLLSKLAPYILEHTVTSMDGTHVNSTGERSFKELTQETKKRHEEGSKSVDDMTDDELTKIVFEVMGKRKAQEAS